MSIGSRIKEARINKKLTQEELAKKIGATKSAIANYENEVSVPKIELLFKLFEVLECDANYLYQDDIKALSNQFILALPEQQMIEKYRALDEHGAKLVRIVLDEEYDRCVKEPEKLYKVTTVTKPNYLTGLSAGTGLFVFDDVPCEQIEVPVEYKDIDFVIGVTGDSMEPTYYEGDQVMIKKGEVRVGEIGAFMVNGEAYIKERGVNELISHNKEYANIKLQDDMKVECIGKVVGKII